MDDLNEMISKIMSDPNSMQQIQAMASSLGLGGNSGAASPQYPAPQPEKPVQQNSNGTDLSALAALLGGLGQPPPVQNTAPDLSALASLLSGLQSQPQPRPQSTPDLSALSGLLGGLTGGNRQAASATPDLSALSGLLGGLTGGNQQTASASPDLSALTALLNGGNPPQQAAPGLLPNIDLSTIMKLSQALASLQSNKANIDLLLALKPRLKDERAKKVDDAIRIMQLIQFLPLIKESGLFGEMDKLLGGLGGLVGGNGGGLGGLLGNVGNGIGGLLGGLGGRR